MLKNVLSVSIIGATLLLSGCGGGSSSSTKSTPTPTAQTKKDIQINFRGLVNGADFSCENRYSALGSNAMSGVFTDYRVYVSEVALIDENNNKVLVDLTQDGKWQYQNVALLDFENAKGSCVNRGNTPETNAKVVGKVENRNYKGISFTLGVPLNINHTNIDAMPSPLNSIPMNWSWQSGRKFTKIEFAPEANITKADGTLTTIWNFHLGSTGCEGNVSTNNINCSEPNRVNMKFDTFNAQTQSIGVDFGSLVKHSVLNYDGGGAVGCMSGQTDPECSAIFSNLALNKGVCIDDCKSQQLFYVK